MSTPTPTEAHGAVHEIAQKIEKYIAAKDIPRTALHAAAGISRPTFNAKMADGGRFSVNELIRISARLDVPVYEILPGKITGRPAQP